MWIISFLPEWVFHLTLTIGILGTITGFVLGFIPLVKTYKIAIQVVSLLILSLGLYLEGGLADYKEWEAKVKELEAKIAVAEEKSKAVNIEVQEKVITQTKVVREKGKDIIKYIDRDVIKKEEIIKYVEQCPVPKEIIDLHNQAAILNKAAEGDKK
jgi:uncharacterized membrane protein (Fun14 family)